VTPDGILFHKSADGSFARDGLDIVIKVKTLPCAGCHLPCGIDCQYACAYIFGRADVSEALPLEFSADKQFSLQIPVLIEGKHFGQRKARTFWFNSVRCAELFLMENGYCKGNKSAIGSGERLLLFMGSPEIAKARASRRSLEYKQAQMAKRSDQPHSTGLTAISGSAGY
jgi:hypothetical protein